MKKLLVICCINVAVISSQSIFSQGYIPFPENYAIWTLHYQNGLDNSQDRFYIFTADGDTTINGTSYNKIGLWIKAEYRKFNKRNSFFKSHKTEFISQSSKF